MEDTTTLENDSTNTLALGFKVGAAIMLVGIAAVAGGRKVKTALQNRRIDKIRLAEEK